MPRGKSSRLTKLETDLAKALEEIEAQRSLSGHYRIQMENLEKRQKEEIRKIHEDKEMTLIRVRGQIVTSAGQMIEALCRMVGGPGF